MGDLPQTSSTDSSNAKKALLNFEFGIGGILFGLIFFILILFVLNYFRVLSLSFIYSKLSILPQRELTVDEKAQKAGFKIAWKGQTEDGSGRAILGSKERNSYGFIDKFGWQERIIYKKFTAPRVLMGLFEEWEKILGSNDYYMTLINPENNVKYKVRILIDKTYLSSAVGTKDLNGGNITALWVEDLSLKDSPDSEKNIVRLGFFRNFSTDFLAKKIKKGDVIKAWSIPLSESEIKAKDNVNTNTIRKDNNGYPVINSVLIRRFDIKNVDI